MKRLFLFFSFALFTLYALATPMPVQSKLSFDYINKKYKVLDRVNAPSNCEIWHSKQLYSLGDTVFLWSGYLVCPFDNAYGIFIDNYPMKSWSHECKYIFVDSSNGELTEYARTLPPKKISDQWIKHRASNAANRRNPTLTPSLTLNQRLSHLQNDALRNVIGNQNLYAIIINYCGPDPEYSYEHYKNDCALMFATLYANGYSTDHIYTAVTDTENDFIERVEQIGNISLPQSNYEIYEATTEGVALLLDDISQVLSEDDILVVYITGHGDFTLSLPNAVYSGFLADDSFGDSFLISHLSQFNVGVLNMVVQRKATEYFNEHLINSINDIPTKVIISSDDVDHRESNNSIDEFTFRWAEALNGVNMGECDLNSDGNISMYEAFSYAKDGSNNPLYRPFQSCRPACLKHSLTLTEELSDYTHCILTDLYIKDNDGDYGDEPNASTNLAYISNDIWIEDMSGNVVDILNSEEQYYVCVNVHNRGLENSTGNEVIHVNWTKAVIGGKWPDSWTGNIPYHCTEGNVITGGEITPYAGLTIPIIPASGNNIIRIPWVTPNSSDYAVCSEFEDDVDQLWHYCLLARIYEDNNRPGEDMTYQPLGEFVLNSNNVASKNIVIMSNNTNNDNTSTLIGISAPYTGFFTLSGIFHAANYEDFINNDIHVYLYLDENLRANWGTVGEGVTDLEDKLELSFPLSNMFNLFLHDNVLYTIKVEVENGAYSNFVFDLTLNDEIGRVLGGERFEHYENAPVRERMQQREVPKQDEIDAINILSLNNENIQKYIIFNALGQIVYSTNSHKQLDIKDIPNGYYSVLVEYTDKTQTFKIIR